MNPYPTRAALRRERTAEDLAIAAHTNNRAIRTILERAVRDLEACDLAGHSMIPGYDLSDLVPALRDMMPQVEGEWVALLEEWAREQSEMEAV